MWRTLHAEGMYPYHVQRVQHLGPGDFAERLEFCKWLNGIRELHRYSLFTDESHFNRDGVNNTHNSHVWADGNPYATVESNFQQRFSVNVWCAVLDDQLIGPFILEGRLTREAYLRFLQEELSRLLEDGTHTHTHTHTRIYTQEYIHILRHVVTCGIYSKISLLTFYKLILSCTCIQNRITSTALQIKFFFTLEPQTLLSLPPLNT